MPREQEERHSLTGGWGFIQSLQRGSHRKKGVWVGELSVSLHSAGLSGNHWCELAAVWSLKNLWAVWPETRFGHRAGNQKFGQGSIASTGLLFRWLLLKKTRWKSCLDPEENNFFFYWHFIDGFWPRVGPKVTPSVTFPLEITLIAIIQSSSRGPEIRQWPHRSIVKQKSPDCSKTMVKVLIPFTTLEAKKKFISQRIYQIPQLL